jgi:hypothetical protein
MDIPNPGNTQIKVPFPAEQNSADGSFTANVSGLSVTFDCHASECVFLPVNSLQDTGLLYVGNLAAGTGGIDCGQDGDGFSLQITSMFRISVLSNCTYRIEAQHLAGVASFQAVRRAPSSPRFNAPFYGYRSVFEADWKTPQLVSAPASAFNNSITALRSAAVISDTTAACVKDLIGVSVSQNLFNNGGDAVSTQGGRCAGGSAVGYSVARPPNTTVTWTITDVFLRT